MLADLVTAVAGGLVWALANVVYYDLKRKGVRNFGRFAAFWVGNPTTWITFFAVRERPQPTFDPQDEGDLLAEIRRDRALRVAEETGRPLTGGDVDETGCHEGTDDTGSYGAAGEGPSDRAGTHRTRSR